VKLKKLKDKNTKLALLKVYRYNCKNNEKLGMVSKVLYKIIN
jgi:hypothetical protein